MDIENFFSRIRTWFSESNEIPEDEFSTDLAAAKRVAEAAKHKKIHEGAIRVEAIKLEGARLLAERVEIARQEFDDIQNGASQLLGAAKVRFLLDSTKRVVWNNFGVVSPIETKVKTPDPNVVFSYRSGYRLVCEFEEAYWNDALNDENRMAGYDIVKSNTFIQIKYEDPYKLIASSGVVSPIWVDSFPPQAELRTLNELVEWLKEDTSFRVSSDRLPQDYLVKGGQSLKKHDEWLSDLKREIERVNRFGLYKIKI